MSFDQLLGSRWSCRSYLPDEVPEDVLAEIFATAQKTASWCNSQPWQVWLLTGEAREEFARRLTAHVQAHPAKSDLSPDLELPREYLGVYLDRRREAGYALYNAMGIERGDFPAREAAMLRNYSFFGAPAIAVVTTPPSLGTYGAIDCGAFVANLMTAAVEKGLGCIAQGALGTHASEVRALLGIPDDRAVVCGVALGYPDPDDPVNLFRTSRAGFDDAVVRLTEAADLARQGSEDE